jgi:predicted nucleic acid-binding protein
LEQAARLRADTALKAPDAIHAATTQCIDATVVITNDPDLRRVPSLPVLLLADFV